MFELVLYPAVVINHLPRKGFCITNVPFKPRKTNKKGKKVSSWMLFGRQLFKKRCLFVLREQQWQVEAWQMNCCKHKTKFLCVACKTQNMKTLEGMAWLHPADGYPEQSYWTISRFVLSMHSAEHNLLPVGARLLFKTVLTVITVIYVWDQKGPEGQHNAFFRTTKWICNFIYFIKCWLCMVGFVIKSASVFAKLASCCLNKREAFGFWADSGFFWCV